MIDWFNSLELREKVILGLGSLLAVAIIGWRFAWVPLSNDTADLREAVAEKSRLVTDLRRAAGLPAGGIVQAGGGGSNQSLVVLVDTTAQPFSLDGKFTRTRPDGPNSIRVSFERAAFDVLVAWLVELEQSHSVAVNSVSFTGAREPGLVSGQVFLQRR